VPSQISPRSHSAIAHATDVTGRSDVVLNLKEKKKPFSFLDLLSAAARGFKSVLFFQWLTKLSEVLHEVLSFYLFF
jgi:hypothetical protein